MVSTSLFRGLATTWALAFLGLGLSSCGCGGGGGSAIGVGGGSLVQCAPAILVQSANSDFFEVDLVTGTVTAVPDDFPGHINAIGYNPLDRKIYGIAIDQSSLTNIAVIVTDQAVRPMHVDVVNIPIPPGTFLGSHRNGFWGVGDCDSTGGFYVTANGNEYFLRIDVDPSSPTYLTAPGVTEIPISYDSAPGGALGRLQITDWSVSPIDGMLYSRRRDSQTEGTLQITDPHTGVSRLLGPTVPAPVAGDIPGASYFDERGGLVFGFNRSGELWRVDTLHTTGGTFLSQGPVSSLNDGASCIQEAR